MLWPLSRGSKPRETDDVKSAMVLRQKSELYLVEGLNRFFINCSAIKKNGKVHDGLFNSFCKIRIISTKKRVKSADR